VAVQTAEMEVEMEVETWGAAAATFEEGDYSTYVLLISM